MSVEFTRGYRQGQTDERKISDHMLRRILELKRALALIEATCGSCGKLAQQALSSEEAPSGLEH